MKHKIICSDVVRVLRDIENESIDMVMTSPPYWGLRDYGEDGQIGLEPTLNEYHTKLLEITMELKRVLKPTGVLFWNHGDSYHGSGRGHDVKYGNGRDYCPQNFSKGNWYQSKCMLLQNERLIIKMVDEQGWILRNRIIWNKPNAMPSSVQDRFSNKYEPVYMLTKNKKYWFDLDAVREPYTEPLNRWGGDKLKPNGKSTRDEGTGQGIYRDRNMRPNKTGKNPGDFWSINTQPFPEAHFAVFPEKLCEKPILACCPAEVCRHCGMARVRITKTIEDINNVPKEGWKKSYKGKIELNGSPQERSVSELYKESLSKRRETISWTDCQCEGEDKYKPGIIIDPFGGSGTVGVVAEKLGRSSIMIDIKKDYCEMAYKRLIPYVRQGKIDRELSVIEKIGF